MRAKRSELSYVRWEYNERDVDLRIDLSGGERLRGVPLLIYLKESGRDDAIFVGAVKNKRDLQKVFSLIFVDPNMLTYPCPT